MHYRSGPDRRWELAQALPHPLLRPGVHGYRGVRLAPGGPRRRLEVPTGEVTLFLGFDRPIRITDAAGARTESFGSLLSGPRTRGSTGEHDGGLYGVEVVMAPWAAYRIFSLPMSELTGRAVELEDVLGARAARTLTGRLAGAPDWPRRFAALDATLVRLHGAGPQPAPQVVAVREELIRTAGLVPVQDLVALSGWSWRQLDRRFREQVGLGPKAVARVLRLRGYLRLTELGRPPAEAAPAAGYYDQAHLCREFRAMTGLTPGRFLAERRTVKPGPPAPDRLSGEVTSVVLPP
ncbi:helix-turn-helix domain-containing protein [Kitasatospora sp. NPDC048540]|uniref:helix-turn-helix domain-containing protein n=1 Tax=Kitasatospora sp. NPDC048540 TaxID=3155634 RepID=UPI0033EB570B